MDAGQDRIRLVVDITLDAAPIQGRISRVEDGWSRPFVGWIDLAGQLEAARGRSGQPIANADDRDVDTAEDVSQEDAR